MDMDNRQDRPRRGATPRGGRRHLDGSPPGKGLYLISVSVTLRPEEIAALERLGEGNRSKAVRRLLEMQRQTAPAPLTEPVTFPAP